MYQVFGMVVASAKQPMIVVRNLDHDYRIQKTRVRESATLHGNICRVIAGHVVRQVCVTPFDFVELSV